MNSINTANQALMNGNLKEAKTLYARIIEQEPGNVFAIHFYGYVQSLLGEPDGLAWMQRSLEQLPDNPAFNHNIAGAYAKNGFKESAIEHFRKAIALKSDYAEAFQGLTEAKKCDDERTLLQQINNLLSNESMSRNNCVYLHFAAGKIYEDMQDFSQAFKHYNLANSLKQVTFDITKHHMALQEKKHFFDEAWVGKHKEFGLYSHKPIFIVGMPRSGSTLVEQILSTHSQVYAAGEITDINAILNTLITKYGNKYNDPEIIAQASEMDLLGYGYAYLEQLKRLSNDAPYVVNKFLYNYLHLGFIFLLFPNAKVIHTTRNPYDTCLSCYFRNFSTGNHFTFNLDILTLYYKDYAELMKHWHALYPEKILEFSYEKLVMNQEESTKELLSFCGLKWEEDCLQFFNNKRCVNTASNYQVRKPIYKSSVNRWESYREFVQPMIKELAPFT